MVSSCGNNGGHGGLVPHIFLVGNFGLLHRYTQMIVFDDLTELSCVELTLLSELKFFKPIYKVARISVPYNLCTKI